MANGKTGLMMRIPSSLRSLLPTGSLFGQPAAIKVHIRVLPTSLNPRYGDGEPRCLQRSAAHNIKMFL